MSGESDWKADLRGRMKDWPEPNRESWGDPDASAREDARIMQSMAKLSMGRCKDCKWWEIRKPSVFMLDPRFVATLQQWEKHHKGWGDCALMQSANQLIHPDICLTRVLSDDDDAGVYTHETFGCVQFTAKEAE